MGYDVTLLVCLRSASQSEITIFAAIMSAHTVDSRHKTCPQ